MSAVLIVRVNVASYDHWRTAYDAGASFRRDGGATDDRVYCSPEDMTSILVLHYFDTVDAANAFSVNPSLLTAMKESGVIGEPHMTITSVVG